MRPASVMGELVGPRSPRGTWQESWETGSVPRGEGKGTHYVGVCETRGCLRSCWGIVKSALAVRRRLLGVPNPILVSLHTRLWNSVLCPVVSPSIHALFG